jgi:hypothetical protein
MAKRCVMQKIWPWLAILAVNISVFPTSADQAVSSRPVDVADNIKFTIAVEKASFAADEPIILRFHLSNHSGRTVSVESPATSVGGGLDIDVRSTSEQVRMPSRYEESQRKAVETNSEYERLGSHFLTRIAPQAQWSDSLDLRKYYSFKPGRQYSIKATIEIEPLGAAPIRIASNKVKFSTKS